MLTMKKILITCLVVLSLAACNSNSSDQENNRDTTNYGNAGMSGTMNANGMLPVDSNKTINGNAGQTKTLTDSSQKEMSDSTK